MYPDPTRSVTEQPGLYLCKRKDLGLDLKGHSDHKYLKENDPSYFQSFLEQWKRKKNKINHKAKSCLLLPFKRWLGAENTWPLSLSNVEERAFTAWTQAWFLLSFAVEFNNHLELKITQGLSGSNLLCIRYPGTPSAVSLFHIPLTNAKLQIVFHIVMSCISMQTKQKL